MPCTCGYGRFVEQLVQTREERVERWAEVGGDALPTGLGTTPLGTYLGTSVPPSASQWQRYEVMVPRGTREVRCASCGRPRRRRDIGGGSALDVWAIEGGLRILMSDQVEPVCLVGRFMRQGAVVIDRDVRVILSAPVQVSDPSSAIRELPQGAVVTSAVYEVSLPPGAGEFVLRLINRCLRFTQPVARFVIEQGGVQGLVLQRS